MQPNAVLVTGASRGIGRAIALTLDQHGFQVFAGVRNPEDGDKLVQSASNLLTPVLLDITKHDSIQSTVEDLTKKLQNQGLYGLINNAGILLFSPVEMIEIRALQEQLNVNVVSQIAVIQAFLPLLRQASGRIINMSSVSGIQSFPFLGAYCASKFALEALSEAMRLELRPFGIKVSLIQPSYVNTTIWQTALKRQGQTSASLTPPCETYYAQAQHQMLENALQDMNSAPSPDVVAQVALRALQAQSPKALYRVGFEVILGKIVTFLPTRLRDWILCQRLGLTVSTQSNQARMTINSNKV